MTNPTPLPEELPATLGELDVQMGSLLAPDVHDPVSSEPVLDVIAGKSATTRQPHRPGQLPSGPAFAQAALAAMNARSKGNVAARHALQKLNKRPRNASTTAAVAAPGSTAQSSGLPSAPAAAVVTTANLVKSAGPQL